MSISRRRFSRYQRGSDLYWLNVPALQKDNLLIASIEKHYSGPKLA